MRKNRFSNLYVKRRVLSLEMDMVKVISHGLIKKQGKRQILKQLKNQINHIAVQELQLRDAEVHKLWLDANSLYNQMSKRTVVAMRRIKRGEATVQTLHQAIYASIRAKIQDLNLIKDANEVMYRYEYWAKHDEIYGNDGLLESATSPFFLASSHPKPAKDHADWEGKMYYDEEWEEKNSFSDTQKIAIRAYIRNRKLVSVQWVLGAPVYLCTRRNCKHFLKNLPLEEVLHSSPKALLKKHKMYHKDEVPVSDDVLNYRKYYARVKLEEQLMDIIPNQDLKRDLVQDKKTLAKWRNMINNKND